MDCDGAVPDKTGIIGTELKGQFRPVSRICRTNENGSKRLYES